MSLNYVDNNIIILILHYNQNFLKSRGIKEGLFEKGVVNTLCKL